jgi:hypothetical protein
MQCMTKVTICALVKSIGGNTVKLREPPKAFTTKLLSKDNGGRANSPGYSKSVKDVTMGNPQPSPKDLFKNLWMQFND